MKPVSDESVSNELNDEQTLSALEVFVRHASFLFAISLLLLPAFLYFLHGQTGAIAGGIVTFVTSPISIDILRNKAPLNFRAFGKSIIRVGKIRLLHYFALVLGNVVLFLVYGLNTLLPAPVMGLLFIVSVVLGLCVTILFPSLWNGFSRQFICFGVAPLLINLFFVVNYTFSSNEYEERYFFTHTTDLYRRGSMGAVRQETTTIILEDHQYDEYPALRFFLDYDELKDSNHIRYTFAEGLFGITVLKKHKFE